MRVKVLQFSNQFLLVLDSDSSFNKTLQSIKIIQKKIQTSASNYKKFGIADCDASLAVHYGSINNSNFGDANIQYELTYGVAVNILNFILSKAQEGEIIITESILTELEEEKKKEFLDINLNVLFLNKKIQTFAMG